MFSLHGLYVAVGAVFVILASAVRAFLKNKVPLAYVLYISPFSLIGGFFGARVMYVLFSGGLYLKFSEKLKLSEGGYMLYGAIIGAFSAIILYLIFTKNKNMILPMLDCVAPGAMLGMSIGRLGAIFFEECYGVYITNPSLQKIPFSVYIPSVDEWCLAVFIFESLICALICVFALIYEKKCKTDINGAVFAQCMILYAGVRTFLESLRYDSVYLGFVRVSQAISAIILIAFFVYFVVKSCKMSGHDIYHIPLYILFTGGIVTGFLAEFYMGSSAQWVNYLILGISCLIMTACVMTEFYIYRYKLSKSIESKNTDINRIYKNKGEKNEKI